MYGVGGCQQNNYMIPLNSAHLFVPLQPETLI